MAVRGIHFYSTPHSVDLRNIIFLQCILSSQIRALMGALCVYYVPIFYYIMADTEWHRVVYREHHDRLLN